MPTEALPSQAATHPASPGTGQMAVPAWHYKDLLSFLGLPLQLAIADRLPERSWPGLALASARFRAGRQPGWCRGEMQRIGRYLGPEVDDSALRRILVEELAWLRLAQWCTLACRRPGGWRPRTRIVARAHLDAALERGRGVVLWVAPLACATLGTKVALAEIGRPVVQLSRESHGPARSRWGTRRVNATFKRGEDRFLAERVVIPNDTRPSQAVLRLIRRLAGNAVVAIMAGPWADRVNRAPFLASEIRLAAGPIMVARRAGARLLPVFTLGEGDGTMVVTLGEPIRGHEQPDAEAAVAAALADFAGRLGEVVRRAPGQLVWQYGSTP
jgi:lauroyl/myristoyl acyltransferase